MDTVFHLFYIYRKLITTMESNEPGKGEEGTNDQTELEKLLEQKQLETEALKRLIDVLEKNDPNKKDNSGQRK